MAGTANYAGIVKWAQLDLQRIQHRDYVGHLSISKKKQKTQILKNPISLTFTNYTSFLILFLIFFP